MIEQTDDCVALLDYLSLHFLTETQLLQQACLSPQVLHACQQRAVMPRHAYRLNVQVCCESYFGPYASTQELFYYPSGYVAWLQQVAGFTDEQVAFDLFRRRYVNRLQQLAVDGFIGVSDRFNSKLDEHVSEEWRHFLEGTYGLCSRSGLPEDIAVKSLASELVEHYLEQGALSEVSQAKLAQAVNLLDRASAMFAPHERPQSSRARLIDAARCCYPPRQALCSGS